MRLEDYFDFSEAPDYIRVIGHRLGVEDIVCLYNQYYTPERIAQEFPGLSLETIYATITYYLHNKAEMDAYIAALDRYTDEQWRLAEENPSPMRLKMRAIKEQGHLERPFDTEDE